jgi:hypothetical protein
MEHGDEDVLWQSVSEMHAARLDHVIFGLTVDRGSEGSLPLGIKLDTNSQSTV